MFLIFSCDEVNKNFLIGVASDQKAVDIATWMAATNPGNRIITGLPIISFSSELAAVRDDQSAIWRIGSLHLSAQAKTRWTWGLNPSRMPPTPINVTRTYKMGLCRGPSYVCRGIAAGGLPLLDLLSPTLAGEFLLAEAQLVCIVPVQLPEGGNKNEVVRDTKRPREDPSAPGPCKERKM